MTDEMENTGADPDHRSNVALSCGTSRGSIGTRMSARPRPARAAQATGRASRWALAAGVAALAVGSAWGDYGKRPEVQAYIDRLVAEHGFERDALAALFAATRRNDDVLARISRPAERALAWHQYRRIFVTDARIAQGVDFWRANRTTLEAAAARFGVAPALVVAIIGVETRYGRNKGSFPVLESLATLAFDYPRRSAFFEGQLTEFLLLAREERMDPHAFKGSYAGAMGFGQFIPSSYRAFAVDFDGDGRRDIWRNKRDAIGSVANYFAEHGWRGTSAAAVRVQAAGEALALANAGLDLDHTVGELRRLGVGGAAHLPADAQAALYRMENVDGAEFWLALHDFYVITRYNRSAMYALAVLQLSWAIAEQAAAQDKDV